MARMTVDPNDVGRIVLYRSLQTQKTGGVNVEVPAIITATKSDGLVDLTVFRRNGLDPVQAVGVPFSNDLTKGWAQAWRWRQPDRT